MRDASYEYCLEEDTKNRYIRPMRNHRSVSQSDFKKDRVYLTEFSTKNY